MREKRHIAGYIRFCLQSLGGIASWRGERVCALKLKFGSRDLANRSTCHLIGDFG